MIRHRNADPATTHIVYNDALEAIKTAVPGISERIAKETLANNKITDPDNVGITFEAPTDEELAYVGLRLTDGTVVTRDLIAKAGISVTNQGYVVINLERSSYWNSSIDYLRGFTLNMSEFGAGLTLADKAYVDIYGTVINKATMRLGATFRTNYGKPKWDTGVDGEGVLNGLPYPADGTPIMIAGADWNYNSQKDEDRLNKYVRGVRIMTQEGKDSPIYAAGVRNGANLLDRYTQLAYYDYDQGYRVKVANDTKHTISQGGTLTINFKDAMSSLKDARFEDSKEELINFKTEKLVFSNELFKPAADKEGRQYDLVTTITNNGNELRNVKFDYVYDAASQSNHVTGITYTDAGHMIALGRDRKSVV